MTTMKLLLAVPIVLFTACSTDDPAPVDLGMMMEMDAGVEVDAGETMDAGQEADAGPPDSGVVPDSGIVLGDPIQAPARQWTWVDFPDSRCMNDTPTGIGVNLNPDSDKVLIYMQGGNACFNIGSCSSTFNRDGYGAGKWANEAVKNASFFDRTAQENIFSDYSYVVVPYCTGDVHAGANPNGMVVGTAYNFSGYTNMTQYLERLAPTFPGVTEVVLGGWSAGGFGSFYNYDQVAAAFGPNVRVTLVDDSGPPMGDDFISPCLQTHFKNTWNLDQTLPPDCDSCRNPNGSFIEGMVQHLLNKYPDRNFGLISSTADTTIRVFWGFGNNQCSDLLPGTVLPSYTPARFQAGLEDLRDRVAMDADNFSLYMPTSDRHVWWPVPTYGPATALWQTEHFGSNLSAWIEAAINDDASWNSVP